MKINWRKSAVESLLDLDLWRNDIELDPIASHLKYSIDKYFKKQDFSVYQPGREVLIDGYPQDLRMVLIAMGKSDPYKVFYRLSNKAIHIFLVRHPRQDTLI